MHSEKLILTKDAKLMEVFWDSDNKKHVTREVMNIPAAHHLHDKTCEIEEGTTLKDILIYMNKNLYFWDVILGNWCSEFVEEGLKPLPDDYGKETQWCSIDYLELYWYGEYSCFENEKSIHGLNSLCFHGQGRYNEDCEWEHYKKDDQTAIGLSLSEVNTLAPHELKINNNMSIYDSTNENSIIVEGEYNPTLFQILHAIMWELSFFGSPKKRDEHSQEMQETIQDIKENPENCIPWEDLKKELEDKLEDIDNNEDEETIH